MRTRTRDLPKPKTLSIWQFLFHALLGGAVMLVTLLSLLLVLKNSIEGNW